VAFVVLVAASVLRVIAREMTRRERRSYDAAVAALKGEGCRAGGKRLLSTQAADYPLCQRALYGRWRMVTGYRRDGSVLIVAVDQHLQETVAAALAKTFPGLSATGRKRSEQPPCCDDAAAPPTLSDELEARLAAVYDLSPAPAATASRRRQARPARPRRTRRPSASGA